MHIRRAAIAFLIFAIPLSISQSHGATPQSRGVTGKSGRTKHISSNSRLQSIRKRGRIIIGLQRDYQPYHIANARKGYPGIDVEVGTNLAESLGVRVEYRYLSLSKLLEAVHRGDIDASLGGISCSLKRARKVNFTGPYLITTPAVLLSRNALPASSEAIDFPRKEFKGIRDLRSLGRLGLGVKKGTTTEILLRTNGEFAKHEIIAFDSRGPLLQALINRKIDAIIADEIYIRSLILKKPELLSSFLPLLKPYREEHICIALPPGDAAYWNYLNFFVREINRLGFMRHLHIKYLENDKWLPAK